MKIMTSTCKCCGQTKTKIRKEDGSKILYVDENNTLWLGKFCPSCKKEYSRSYQRKESSQSQVYTKKCEICSTDFSSKFPNKKYCSKLCFKKRVASVRKLKGRKK